MLATQLSWGVLALSIDLEPDPRGGGLDPDRCLDPLVRRLLEVLAHYRAGATWAVADPAFSAATDQVMAGGNHEMAILGDGTWAGPSAGRGRFARELERRVAAGRAAGMAIDTLVLRERPADEHVDLIVRQGLSAICGPSTANTGAASGALDGQPRSLHFGLWELPAAARIGQRAGWLRGIAGSWRIQRGIRRAVARRAVYHLAIDAVSLAGRGLSAVRLVERLLRHAESQRRAGLLRIATLGEVAALLSGTRRAAPSRSILRAAA